MAGTSTNISIRMDTDLKTQADALFQELGMNLSTAFNIFVRQSLREGGIPFEIKLDRPNKETAAAMREADTIANDPSAKAYDSLDELFAALKNHARLGDCEKNPALITLMAELAKGRDSGEKHGWLSHETIQARFANPKDEI